VPQVATPGGRERLERGAQATTPLLVAHLRLVTHIAKGYQHLSALALEDLVQEGTLGLLRAVETFDATKGYRFTTYAGAWIRRSIGHALVDRGTTIRLPRHVAYDVHRLQRVWRALACPVSGQPPTLDALAAALAWTPAKTQAIAAIAQAAIVSLDAVVDAATGHTLQDGVAAETPGPEAVYLHAETRARLEEALHRLPARHRAIVQLRFGVDTDHAWTLAEVGAQFGVSPERVRQLQAQALATLRSHLGGPSLQEPATRPAGGHARLATRRRRLQRHSGSARRRP
jgi:RNA polymerase primary sigma factor